MNFREVKEDIRKGHELEYFTKWYNYDLHITVLGEDIYYFLMRGINTAYCRINKDKFLNMSYKELIRTLNDTLYYFNVY